MITRDDAKAITQAINGAIGSALDKLVAGPVNGAKFVGPGADYSTAQAIPAAGPVPAAAVDFEILYQKIKRRLVDEARVDPVLLHLLVNAAPELSITVEPRILELTDRTLKGRLAKLAAGGFFKTAQTQADTNRELKRTGAEAHTGRLSEAFTDLVNEGILTREASGFQLAPGVKVTQKALEA